MRHSFSIYFYLKRRKLQKDSKSTIMLRIIVDNKAADVSLKTSILQEHWDKQNRRVSAINVKAHDINAYLDKVSSTLQLHYRQAQLEGKQLTASILKQRFMATGSNPLTLLKVFDKQMKDADRLAHAGQISMSHSNRHKLVYRRLEEFCKKMGRQDMALEQFDRLMIHELELFFRTDCRLSINTEYGKKRNPMGIPVRNYPDQSVLNLPNKEGRKPETIPEQAGNNKDNEQAAGYSQTGFHP